MIRLNLANRRRFYESRTLRELAAALRWALRRSPAPDLAHLAFHDAQPLGPIQQDEAILLHGLVRTIRPRTVVEIGFWLGDSAYNFLRALDDEAVLYSFDIDPDREAVARRRFGDDPRFVYRTRAQETLTPADVDGRSIDLLFIDGAHELGLNQETFGRLVPMLSPDAIVAVHDTAVVAAEFIPVVYRDPDPKRWIGDFFEHQPDERAFVNWLRREHPEFAQLHLHTDRFPRCGLTLLQRTADLPRPPGVGPAQAAAES